MMKSESESSSSVDPPLLPLPPGEYEVFLSFRGGDVRNDFADHLYNSLTSLKIRTFRDEEELRKGEFIAPALMQAITESKVYVPIFSVNYAASKWCLMELAKMVERWKAGQGGKGQPIFLPVFYLIDPRGARHPETEPYKEAFEEHSRNHDPETVSAWKEALKVVGTMKGWHVTKSDAQGAVVEAIFSNAEKHLRAHYTLVTEELVGIDFHVEKIMKMLNPDSASEKIVGIHGMGGLGKTTLAKVVYDKVCTQFERCCFVENIRETLVKTDGIVTLQNKILSDILRKDSNQAKNASDGIRMMRERVSKHKLLIVLDDVDGAFKFDDVLGGIDCFSPDSRFLITTRDARVFELLKARKVYELGEMSHNHALKLFSKHAFRTDCPPKGFTSLSMEFVKGAAGLPLYLKVIGSLLFEREKSFWEDTLKEHQGIPPTEVQERLSISYKVLKDNEQQIFLDVACLFVGEKKEAPIHMWSDCGFNPTSAISNLVKRCLVRIDDDNKFQMHDHVRDLGRAIVRKASDQTPYECSRIWSNHDAINMLKCKKGTASVKALEVNMKGEDQVLTNKEFHNLFMLRFLMVYNGRLAGNFKEVLPNLCWLGLINCDSVPSCLNLKKLVVLQFEESSLGDGWKGWNELKVAHNLKVVSLKGCYNLKEVPDLSKCEALEVLDFRECPKMRGELDIRNLKNLKLLGISKTKISKIKGDIGRLENLKHLDASQSCLVKVPAGISKLSSLEILKLKLTPPNKLEMTEKFPESLKTLTISSSFLSALPSSLTYLESCYCEDLPNLSNATNLLQLHLRNVEIRCILGLKELKLLETLVIEKAPKLDNLDGLEKLWHLEELRVEGCLVLEKMPSLAALTRLEVLEIENCPVLTGIHGVGELWDSLLVIEVRGCSSLTGFKALHSMLKLESLVLMGTELTNAVPPSLSPFTKLGRLALCNMSLVQFPDLSNLKNLRDLWIKFCEELVEVPGLDTLVSLEFLNMEGCRSVRELRGLFGLVNLKTLQVNGCEQLTEVRGLGTLESLEYLDMSGCKSIKELPNLSGLKILRKLQLKKCKQLKELKGFDRLESLQVFEADTRLKVKYAMRFGMHS
ncbi:Disease resistance protein L6 [Linum grandiflorum]